MRKKNAVPAYTPAPIDTKDVEFTPEIEALMESLAENAHDVWAAGRIAEGWKYGKKRSDRKKTHPCLVPYSELPESEKEYDRQTSAQALKCIMKLGFEIKKKD